MIKQTEIEEIKKLIRSGFDLELISFELDVPIEQVKQCKIELENGKVKNAVRTNCSERDIIKIKNNQPHSKIEQMRERYRQLYFRSNKVEIAKPKELSNEELALINTVLETIRDNIQEMEQLSKKEKIKIASSILSELKKVEDYQLPIEQAEEFYTLMCSEQLKGLNISTIDRIDYYIHKQRRKCAVQVAKSIEIKESSVDDLEELLKLQEKITYSMVRESPIYVGRVKNRISNKITAIRQQQALARIRDDISESINTIITDLASGNIDIQKANAMINEETKRRIEKKPRTKFSLKEEQERGQILIQIRMAIAEKSEQYHIQDPEKAVLQIQELCGGSLGLAMSAVVKNLIQRKEFETAKGICDKFSKTEKESEHIKYVRGLKNEIRNAEISDIVMKAINMRGTDEEERACFELVEKGLKMGHVKLSAISLGQSEDGLENITLADIWTDDIKKDISR